MSASLLAQMWGTAFESKTTVASSLRPGSSICWAALAVQIIHASMHAQDTEPIRREVILGSSKV